MAGKADGDAKVLAAKADEDATILAAKSGEDATVMAANADEDEKTDDYLNKMAAKGDEKAKIVNDPVYGTIHLDLLAVKIIDTPCFQRLRYIKQLAFADFVYPGATHTRFAHSIGVYHLACQMIKEIESHPFPKGAVQMSPEDKRCIRVAALCHDLGHGPFSHLYEQIGASVLGEDIGKKLKHEQISQFLVGKMFEECSLKDYLGPKPDEHIQLIKDLIERNGDLPESENGRKYMFQIVSNKESGVDVDKWDYFNRDAIACGVPERFQYDRALSVARVVETKPGMFELGYRDYDAFSMYNMFNTRFTLYRKVYKHKVVQAVDLMITDVCKLVCGANTPNNEDQSNNIELYPIPSQLDLGRPESFMRLDSEHYLDVKKFLMLRDDVLLKIWDSSGKYKEASDLLQRLHERKLYKLVHDLCVKAPPCECAKKKADTGMAGKADGDGKVLAAKADEEAKIMAPNADEEAKVMAANAGEDTKTGMAGKADGDGKVLAAKADEDAKIMAPNADEEAKVMAANAGEDTKTPQCECAKKEAERIKECFKERLKNENENIAKEVEVVSLDFNYGRKQNNPVQELYFYSKKEYEKGVPHEKDEVSLVLPNVFQEYHVRVYEKFSGNEKYESEVETYKESLDLIAPQCECAKKKAEEIKKFIEDSLKKEKGISKLVEVVLLPFNYGSKQKNPVLELYFYSKTNYEKGVPHNKDEVSLVLPDVFEEYHVRVYEKFSGNKNYESEEVETYRKTLERIVGSDENSGDKDISPSKKQNVDCK